MSSLQWILLVASALSGALLAFPGAAQARGWRRGQLLSGSSPLPLAVAACCILVGSIALAIVALADKIGWLWVLWCALANWAGGGAIIATLGPRAGPLALVGAPIASGASMVIALLSR